MYLQCLNRTTHTCFNGRIIARNVMLFPKRKKKLQKNPSSDKKIEYKQNKNDGIGKSEMEK